jgi:hypothetical protein
MILVIVVLCSYHHVINEFKKTAKLSARAGKTDWKFLNFVRRPSAFDAVY